jgi:membrane-associated protease RseP (regulator of RpoE activity)
MPKTQRSFSLGDALLLVLLLLLPVMLLVGAAETGPAIRPGLLFWLLLLLPVLFLPWVLWPVPAEREVARDSSPQDSAAVPSPIANEFATTLAPALDVRRAYLSAGVPVAEGKPRTSREKIFAQIEQLLAPRHITPVVEDAAKGDVKVAGLPSSSLNAPAHRSRVTLHIILFLATVATTLWVGGLQQGVNLLTNPGQIVVAAPYAITLLGILGIHELGHYFVARWHGVDVTLPYFIPVPMGLGTFGAFVQMKSAMRSRRIIFDIGVAGPLAGLVVAVIALYYGLRQSGPIAGTGMVHGAMAGSSLLLGFINKISTDAPLGAGVMSLSPVALAGWIGLLVTALNLLPVGQLDGGHIAYALFGRRYAWTISGVVIVLMIALGLFVWPGLLTWAIIVALIAGFSHEPALDDVTPVDAKRLAIGAFAFVLLFLILLPVPGAPKNGMLNCPYISGQH